MDTHPGTYNVMSWDNLCSCILYSDYEVLSEFTLAFLEDTGWYVANYSALSELNQNSLQWGKGIMAHSHCILFSNYSTSNGCRFRVFIYDTKM